MIESHKKGNLDLSQVTTFNLDEYIGLKGSHPQSYYFFMQQELFKHVNVPSGSQPRDKYDAYCRAYERKMTKAGGVDLQI